MAKKVFLIRHAKQKVDSGGGAWQIGAWLADEADDQIKALVEYLRNIGAHFDAYWHSSIIRSFQTCEKIRKQLGNGINSKLNAKLGPGEISEWERAFEEWKKDIHDPENLPRLTAAEIAKLWPELCVREGERVLQAVGEIVRGLRDGQAAAAISHNPLINLARVATEAGYEIGPDLKHCEMICFVFDEDNRFATCVEHRFMT